MSSVLHITKYLLVFLFTSMVLSCILCSLVLIMVGRACDSHVVYDASAPLTTTQQCLYVVLYENATVPA